MMLKIKQIGLLAVAFSAMLILFAGCGDKKDGDDRESLAELAAETVSSSTTTSKITTQGPSGLTFEALIVSQGADTDWCSFDLNSQLSVVSGNVGTPIYLYLKKNTTEENRSAKIDVTYTNGYSTTLTLTQQSSSVTPPGTDYNRVWGEQPLYREGDDYIYKTYFTTLATGKYVRNYSICYDTRKKVSNWVAYPLHRSYVTPSTGRTDDWAYDPNNQLPVIPTSDQQYIVETYGTGYARGHQIPSADRYSTDASNRMTFYATNMMPQNGTFNSGIWGSLEGKIRTNMLQMNRDTLYVVTGTLFGDNRTTHDRKGNTIGVPSNCWKVLLRTRSGNTGKPVETLSADDLMGIGFWFSNSTSNPSSLSSCVYSIAEIESKTGFTFFHNLPDDVAKAVKKQRDFSAWGM